jgi:hypothetical protein
VLPWPGGNASVAEGRVVRYDKDGGLDSIDYGVQTFTPRALEVSPSQDLTAVQAELARTGALAAYAASKRFYEIGTPAGLRETDRFLRAQQSRTE